MPIRVLVVDDHPTIRQVLGGFLNTAPGIQWVGEAENGQDGVDLALKLKPDVVLMDVSMQGMTGIEATRQIKKLLPEIKVVALTVYDDTQTVRSMMAAGAEGYLIKNSSEVDIMAAIFRVVQGAQFVSEEVGEMMAAK
jgi:DNA-binding NarL/FixJ family response regulator